MAIIERSNLMPGTDAHAQFTSAGVPQAGDFNDQAAKGALCIDTTNGVLYINTGTKASTTWTKVGLQT